jgi:transitional endoplasmic reticulum ATPase
MLAKAVATESEANFISIKGPEFFSKWVGESEKAVRETFKKARAAAPCIVFFDEIDAIVPTRGGGSSDTHVTERIISQILTELDGLEDLHDVLVIGATNRADIIDPALLRPGRFDRLINISMPDLASRKEIFRIHLSGKPVDRSIKIDKLAKESEGLSGADISAIVNEAVMLSIREYIDSGGKEGSSAMTKNKLRAKHLKQAMEKVKQGRSLRPDLGSDLSVASTSATGSDKVTEKDSERDMYI